MLIINVLVCTMNSINWMCFLLIFISFLFLFSVGLRFEVCPWDCGNQLIKITFVLLCFAEILVKITVPNPVVKPVAETHSYILVQSRVSWPAAANNVVVLITSRPKSIQDNNYRGQVRRKITTSKSKRTQESACKSLTIPSYVPSWMVSFAKMSNTTNEVLVNSTVLFMSIQWEKPQNRSRSLISNLQQIWLEML